MCHYSTEDFEIFMLLRYGIEVDEEKVKEEQFLLYKEELDNQLVSFDLLANMPEIALIDVCSYATEENEWKVYVASDIHTYFPLFLICLRDGEKIYEEDLRLD